MPRRTSSDSLPARLWVLPGLALVAALVGPLLIPGQVLTEGDLPFFHLPLRQVLAELASTGELPRWNPWLHGGQPILSNPNYAPFYPPTWIALLSPAYSLQVLVVLHGLVALFGAWRLARGLGAGPPASALAATGFAAGPWFLSLVDTVNLYCGMAWLPWVLRWGLAAVGEGSTRSRGKDSWLAAGALVAQLLAGEPVAVILSALALGILGLVSSRRRLPALRSLAGIGLIALGLGAVQLLPAASRVLESPRAGGLEEEAWSAPPARLVELAFPRYWGDPQRDEEGLYFGWDLHDRSYPYVEMLFVGFPLLVLGVSACLDPRSPDRRGWLVLSLAGLFLGLGRFNPLYPLLGALPPLSWVRYPEKFLLLTVVSLLFGGTLALDRLVCSSPSRARRLLRVPLALATGLAVASLALGVRWWHVPGAVERFVEMHSGLPPTPELLRRGASFLRWEALAAAVAALVLLGLLWLGRRRPRSLGLSLLALTILQLVHYDRGLNPTLPRERVLAPPPLARSILDSGKGRLFTDAEIDPAPEIHPRAGPVGFHQVLGKLSRLDPYAATLWGIPYSLHEDYDLLSTRWNRHARDLFLDVWPDPEPSRRILGAWGTRYLLSRTDPRSRARRFRATGAIPPPARLTENPRALPVFRSVSEMIIVPRDTALDRLRDTGFRFGRTALCLAEGSPPDPGTFAPARILEVGGSDQSPRVEYRADDEAFLVVAITFDEGWRARLEGSSRTLRTCVTALGQIGVALPPGYHRLRLEYRDPLILVGGGTTLATFALGLWLHRRRRPEASRKTREA